MLNNRLEDLIIIYKNYRLKKFIKSLFILLFIIIFMISNYFLYKILTNIKTKKTTTKDVQIHKKINKLDLNLTKKKKIIKKVAIKKINEEKVLKKNTLKALIIIERDKPTYQSALDIAKYYYKHKNYQISSKWATIANNRDEKQEESLILFTKAKIKLHQKGIAKKALKIYLLKYHSQKIINLLNSL